MDKQADKAFVADKISFSQAGSTAKALFFANSRERITVSQIENLRKKAKRRQAVHASDTKATQHLLQQLHQETGAALMHQHYKPETDMGSCQESVIIIAAPFQIAMLLAFGPELALLDATGATNKYDHAF